MQILEFEWDEGNVLHFELGHGIEPEEAEEIFVNRPLFQKTKKGHYVAFGPTGAGRYLIVIFEKKPKGIARPITGWDMNQSEVQYYTPIESKISIKSPLTPLFQRGEPIFIPL